MTTPIKDAYEENAASGVKKVVVDGELVEMHSLDEQRRAADAEAKRAAASSGAGRAGIKFFRVRSGGAYPQ